MQILCIVVPFKKEVIFMKFEYKTVAEQKKLGLEELEEYYRQLRKYEYESNMPLEGIELRKMINRGIISFLKMDRLIKGKSLTLLRDDRIYSNKSKIYVVTHIGRYDIEMAMESIKESSYLLMGDPGETYRNFDGVMLNTKGVIYFDTNDFLDRKIAKETSKKVLDQGGNIFIFSEGAWNTTENEIVTKLYDGAIDMAKPTKKRPEGSEIIPMALEQYGLKYYSYVGKNIDVFSGCTKTSREFSDDLRDVLCTLKFYIWNKFTRTNRESFPRNYRDIFNSNIMSESSDEYTITEIERTIYKDKNVTSPEEAFSFMKNLKLTKDNAFLWRESLAYRKEQTVHKKPFGLKDAIEYTRNLIPTESNALLLGEVVTFIKNQKLPHGNIALLNEVLTFMRKLELSKEKAILLREVYDFIKKLDFSKEKIMALKEISLFIKEIKLYHRENNAPSTLIHKKKVKEEK